MEQYQEIVQWVASLAETDSQASRTPVSVEPRHDPPVQAMLPGPPRSPVSEEIQSEPGPTRKDPVASSADSSPGEADMRSRRESSVKRGRPLKRFTPVDAFDPEIFNRKFSPK